MASQRGDEDEKKGRKRERERERTGEGGHVCHAVLVRKLRLPW